MLDSTGTVVVNMPREGFESIGIPSELYEAIAKYIRKNPQLGYTGVPEFVRDVLRDALQSRKPVEVAAS
jgi:hypothetical protein